MIFPASEPALKDSHIRFSSHEGFRNDCELSFFRAISSEVLWKMIFVKNRKTYKGAGIYVGRAMPAICGSVLGNPYKVKPHGAYELDESLCLYRRWLWQHLRSETGAVYGELLRLKRLAKQGDLTLICWCEPAPCHANIIKSCLEWMADK